MKKRRIAAWRILGTNKFYMGRRPQVPCELLGDFELLSHPDECPQGMWTFRDVPFTNCLAATQWIYQQIGKLDDRLYGVA